MRAVILLTLALIATAAAGAGLVALAGWKSDWRAMGAAAAIVWIASMMAAGCLWFVRGATQASVAQGALVGTMVHMFAGVVGAAVAILGKVGLGTPFLYWLLAFYWVTLIVLVALYVKAVQAAPSATGSMGKQ